MKTALITVLLLAPTLLLAFNLFGSDSEQVFNIDERFERRKQLVHSFRNPFYLVRGAISFWTASGSTVITNDYIRLTPAEKSRAGSIWNSKPTTFNSWEVEMSFKVGSTSALGADGFALWYTKESRRDGPVFGNQDQWDGLGVFFDTFDNDGSSDNPSINVFRNDGTWSYNSGQDGKHQSLGHCRLYYRNYETQVKLTYVDSKLQILSKLQNQNDWTICTTVVVNLPQGYYFGLTAATGGLVDNHDVYRFETSRLVSREEGGNPNNAYEGRAPVYEGEYQRNRYPTPPPYPNKAADEDKAESDPNEPLPVKPTPDGPVPTPNVPTNNQFKKVEKVEPLATSESLSPVKPISNDQIPAVVATLQRDIETVSKNQIALQQSLQTVQQSLNTFNDNLQKDSDRLSNIMTQQKTFTERFDSLVANLPTKTDLKSINIDSTEFGREINQLKAQLDELKKTVETKSSQAVSSSQIDSLSRLVNEIRGKIESSRQHQSEIESNIRNNQQQISSSIESSGSLSFWIFFVLFQVVFGVSFMWWKKYRDESTKKLI